jgi:hypothetical protein
MKITRNSIKLTEIVKSVNIIPLNRDQVVCMSDKARTWFSMINESVHASDDHDIGDVYAVNRFFLVVKRGIVNVHYYYIPLSKIEGWDSHVLWLKVTEDEVKTKYEIEASPDPSTYYVKEHAYYSVPSPLPLIPLKLSKYENEYTGLPSTDVPRVYSCPLCNVVFQTEGELGKHLEQAGH